MTSGGETRRQHDGRWGDRLLTTVFIPPLCLTVLAPSSQRATRSPLCSPPLRITDLSVCFHLVCPSSFSSSFLSSSHSYSPNATEEIWQSRVQERSRPPNLSYGFSCRPRFLRFCPRFR
ncbi:hypothetical protein DFP72DRAFT_980642 [Ephemerocybe angulata]|uniref:Uncharacterized protein n=1 Tax=Ephemerocybe angulata TaxID=980116 RepID=A0A8H6H9B2_9AGAR|nr:hypothetical protein DFP72DRAFT_980642 [Tulosesus angulatus]